MTKREKSKECYAVKNIVKKYMSYIYIYTLHIYMLLKQGYWISKSFTIMIFNIRYWYSILSLRYSMPLF